jgi:hypothetical protein
LATQADRLQETISFFRVKGDGAAARGLSNKRQRDGKPEVHKQIAKAQSFQRPKTQATAPKAPAKATGQANGFTLDMNDDEAIDADFKRQSVG